MKGLRLIANFPLLSLRNWGLLLLLAYCLTIGYRLFYGENRLSELSRLQLKQVRLESQYAGLRFERKQLESGIANLQDGSVNLVALEVLVRAKLKMARQDEVVIIMPETQKSP